MCSFGWSKKLMGKNMIAGNLKTSPEEEEKEHSGKKRQNKGSKPSDELNSNVILKMYYIAERKSPIL